MRSIIISVVLCLASINFVKGIDRGPVTDEEKAILSKLREELIDETRNDPVVESYTPEWLERTKDIAFVNWLRYSDFDEEKTKELIKKSLKWRVKNDMDNIVNWNPPKYFEDNFFKFKVTGFSKIGEPVMYTPFGRFNLRAAIQDGHRDDLIRLNMKIFEEAMYKMRNSENSDTIGNFIWIADMDKFTLSQVTSLRVLSTTGVVVGLWEANWPYTPSNIFIINAPGYFSVLFEVIKRVVSAKSIEPVSIHPNFPSELIESLIDKESLPKNLGGYVDL